MIKISQLIFITLYLFLSSGMLLAQVKITTWNLQNFGKSKSDTEIAFIAGTLQNFDIVSLQEVVAGYGGAQAVARLADELTRTGARWDYVVSNATVSTPYATERYAFLWKTAQVKRVQEPWLDQSYVHRIDREPYMMDFRHDGNVFTLVSFHAIPKNKQPEMEIKYFKFLPGKYPGRNLIFLGDFNIPQRHTVFNPLKKAGYLPVVVDQKTTMKMKCAGEECLASEYDNIFYNSKKIELLDSGVILFYEKFPDMISARQISDHIPVWAEFDFSRRGNSVKSVMLGN